MIDPAEIPRIDGDMAELAEHADRLDIAGYEIADTGTRIHRTWQGLGAVYDAPEADQLFAATGPVASGSTSVGEDLNGAAVALRHYATETTAVQTRLEELRGQAVGLVDAYAGAVDESTTAALDVRGAQVRAE